MGSGWISEWVLSISLVMSKRLVDIDPELLERARAVAGTQTIKATVEAGLKRLVGDDLGLRHIRHLRQRGVVDPKRLAEVRSPRVPLR